MIKLKNITKIYENEIEKLKVLDDISMEINSGDFISIQGKSGSGKTSLLNILGLLDSKYQGEYIYEDMENSIDYIRAKNIGFVFQFHYLLEEFTVLENIILAGLNLKEKTYKEIEKDALEILKIIDMDAKKNNYPIQLSGGEKQRVAIARALINHPKIILADEPTGNLDTENSQKINELFLKLNKEYNQAIVVVTHSLELANIADKKYFLDRGKLVKINVF